MDVQQKPDRNSPFHAGEKTLQTRANMRDAIEATGRRIVRPFMPDQHRDFFEKLPFVVLGSVDSEGWPWASILAGTPGFVRAPTGTRLDLNAVPLDQDPLSRAIAIGSAIAVLGVEIPTRRRNRMNGRVIARDGGGVSLGVDQSFGNCPQYIQTRDIKMIRDPNATVPRPATQQFVDLDDAASAFIAAADTFFVASYIETRDNPANEGVDVSHRGGRAGFVKVEGNTLTIPDFPGNKIFNTLGNFLLNPRAGLIFPNFETGDILSLTGTVEILETGHPVVRAFQGAERAWRFHLDHGIRIQDALPFRAQFTAFSDHSLMAGTWAETDARLEAENARVHWRRFRLARVHDESSVIKSFYFEPVDDAPVLPFLPGQFLTLRAGQAAQTQLVRTYTVSSPPGDAGYRISVKREKQGAMSRFLHDDLGIGGLVDIKAPGGAFYLDAAEKRPAVLLAGGVGITPMISMAHHVYRESKRTRHLRPLDIFYAARTAEDRAFDEDFRTLARESGGKITYHSVLSQPDANTVEGVHFDASGHITAAFLKQALGLDDYDFYLCGPAAFMQSTYDILRRLGVRDVRIFAEGFGPAALARRSDETKTDTAPQEADDVVVEFTASGVQRPWQAGGETLLETAEAQGLSPAFSCRSGQCGSCAVKKLSGEVVYRQDPSATIAEEEVLICCAVPAKGSDTLKLDL